MERVMDLPLVIQHEVEDYAKGHWWKSAGYAVSDISRRIYTVVVVPDRPRPFPARVVVMARIVDNYVVIDEDTTDRPLWQELVQAGIPRAKIICLYAGEQIPDGQPG